MRMKKHSLRLSEDDGWRRGRSEHGGMHRIVTSPPIFRTNPGSVQYHECPTFYSKCYFRKASWRFSSTCCSKPMFISTFSKLSLERPPHRLEGSPASLRCLHCCVKHIYASKYCGIQPETNREYCRHLYGVPETQPQVLASSRRPTTRRTATLTALW